ncbi:(2Fe-2S)-binding protein [Gemmata sp. JC717]|uniref:(2Fe-2S)-binding protein n=1 Tax=Gemmata algarum TaxID=2975278 RepID=UPI0021BB4D54|nr:(2Fe-2S)-binding protein [Gemmata algarum]MDY3556674.1 (2Fe-2S)-binding protein [Gemmata algarum]
MRLHLSSMGRGPMELNQAEDCTGSCRTCPAVGSCPDRVVCRCLQVTEQTLISAIVELGLRTVKEVRRATEAGTGCNCCHREVSAYLAVYASSSSPNMCSAK